MLCLVVQAVPPNHEAGAYNSFQTAGANTISTCLGAGSCTALAKYVDGVIPSRYAQPSFPPTDDLSTGYISWEGKKEEKGMASMWFFRSCSC